MIPALNPATLGAPAPDLRAFIALAERAGFGGADVDLNTVMQAAAASSWDAIRFLFEQYEVAPAAGGLAVDWRGSGEDGQAAFDQSLAKLPAQAEAARNIGCERICTWLPPAIDGDPGEFRARSAERFHQIAAILADQGLRLGLEFVGPETLRHGPGAMGAREFVHTLPQTLRFIAEIDASAKNVGLLIDSFHWFCTGSSVGELAALDPGQIVHVHINDAPPGRPLQEQTDKDRLLPGQGAIDLRAFLTTIAKTGYREFVSVEVFSDALKAQGTEAAAERAGEAVEQVFERVFAGRN